MNWDEIRGQAVSMMTTLLLPAMATSLAVMLLVRRPGGKHLGAVATLLAVTGAMYVVQTGTFVKNELSSKSLWLLNEQRPLRARELGKALLASLEERKPDASGKEPAQDAVMIQADRRTSYWIPWLAAVAMLIEFFVPLLRVPSGLGWTLRTAIALLAGRLLVPSDWRMDYPWLSWAMGLVILLEWALLTSLARCWQDGAVMTALAFCCVAAAVVLQAAHYLSMCEWSLLLGSSLVGPAFFSWRWPSDTSPAAACCAIFLPGLLLQGKYFDELNAVPIWSFLLAGLAPLALLPAWLPFLARRERWIVWVLWTIMPLIPAAIAVVWALRARPLMPE